MILALLVYNTVLVSILAVVVGLLALDVRHIRATQNEILTILREAYPELFPPAMNGARGRHVHH